MTAHYVKINLAAHAVQRKTFNGTPHLIVPATLLTEGVHNGSSGALYYPLNEIEASVSFWDGVQVTNGHPIRGNSPASARSPEIAEQYQLGTVFNSRMEGTKLKAQLYLNLAQVAAKAPKLLEKLNKGEDCEISTGLFSTDEPTPGTWNGEPYEGVVRQMRPDHLAVLLNQRGACSLRDGCGIRANWKTDWSLNSAFQSHLKGGRNTMTTNEQPLLLPVLNWEEPKRDPACICHEPGEVEPLLLPTLNFKEV